MNPERENACPNLHLESIWGDARSAVCFWCAQAYPVSLQWTSDLDHTFWVFVLFPCPRLKMQEIALRRIVVAGFYFAKPLKTPVDQFCAWSQLKCGEIVLQWGALLGLHFVCAKRSDELILWADVWWSYLAVKGLPISQLTFSILCSTGSPTTSSAWRSPWTPWNCCIWTKCPLAASCSLASLCTTSSG